MMHGVYSNYNWDSNLRSSGLVELPSVQTRRRGNDCCRGIDWRSFGIILSLLAASSLALGVADVVLTHQKYMVNRGCGSKSTEPPCDPNNLIFTWVAVGIWASLPIFVLGIFAIRLGRRGVPQRSSWFDILAFLSTFLFAPALIALSVVEIYKGIDVYYWKAYNGADDDLAKAIIPIVIGSLGIIELLMSLIALSYVCCCSTEYKNDSYVFERPDTVSRTFLQARKPGCVDCQGRPQVYPASQAVIQPVASKALYQPATGFSSRPTPYGYFNNPRPCPHNQGYSQFNG